ncbi:hypothetical protein C8J57DRAFT_748240 [Mycena rebaudengoi]|nr:hypothetical protein C8J57DRAFT_748240 [Mycena rebaudengoi]
MSVSLRQHFPPEFETCYPPSRRQLLTDVNIGLYEEEVTAETLLKSFDLTLYDCDTIRVPSLSDVDRTETGGKKGPTVDLRSHPENPFLSTPLRLKHFPRLSPSILRGLLRSPSLRHYSSCDDSLETSIPLDSAEPGSPLSIPRGFPHSDSSHMKMPPLPLTPPPSAHIPYSSQFLDPDLRPDDSFSTPASAWYSDGDAAAAKSKLPHGPKASIPSYTAHKFQANGTLISPSTVRNFRRVIDEMQGLDHSDHDRSEQATKVCTGHHSFLSLASGSSPSSLVPPELDACEIPSLSFDDSPRAIDRHTLGTLEDEFVSLLEQRAAEEEADAEELRALADRLERMGRGRRRLATLISRTKAENGG